MDDEELIDALADGDHTALRELFTRHAPWLAAGRWPALWSPMSSRDSRQRTAAVSLLLAGVIGARQARFS
jgi:hypothetical protein